MSVCDLTDKACEPCQGGVPPLSASEVQNYLKQVHDDWDYDRVKGCITRRLIFKGFAKAVYTANLAAFLADREGHHPDVSFGWGYCSVTFTTHEAGGLTENDFICAAKFDQMIAPG